MISKRPVNLRSVKLSFLCFSFDLEIKVLIYMQIAMEKSFSFFFLLILIEWKFLQILLPEETEVYKKTTKIAFLFFSFSSSTDEALLSSFLFTLFLVVHETHNACDFDVTEKERRKRKGEKSLKQQMERNESKSEDERKERETEKRITEKSEFGMRHHLQDKKWRRNLRGVGIFLPLSFFFHVLCLWHKQDRKCKRWGKESETLTREVNDSVLFIQSAFPENRLGFPSCSSSSKVSPNREVDSISRVCLSFSHKINLFILFLSHLLPFLFFLPF